MARIALGVRRLSIVDVEGGHQPVFNEDDTVIAIQNGELYNHVARRLDARGPPFRQPLRYRDPAASLRTRRSGVRRSPLGEVRPGRLGLRRPARSLARDRLGVKPLYWARSGDSVVFASELKCLLASGLVEPRVDYDAVDVYLTLGYVPAPRTLLKGVNKLLPGHALVIEDGTCREEAYWRFPTPAPDDRPAGSRNTRRKRSLCSASPFADG